MKVIEADGVLIERRRQSMHRQLAAASLLEAAGTKRLLTPYRHQIRGRQSEFIGCDVYRLAFVGRLYLASPRLLGCKRVDVPADRWWCGLLRHTNSIGVPVSPWTKAPTPRPLWG